MKFKDIYTSLNRDIDLQRFHPKINIEVESFNYSQKEIDISQSLQKTINASGNKKIIVKPLSKKYKPFDSVFQEKKSLIAFSPENKKRFKLGYIKSKLINFGEYIQNISTHSKVFTYTSIIVCIFVLVFFNKFLVEYNTNSGYTKLISLQDTESKQSIESTINSAHRNFSIANFLYTPFKIIPNKDIQNAEYIIQGGKKITTVARKNINLLNSAGELIEEKGVENILFSQLLLNNKKSFQQLETDITNIESIYNNIQFTPKQLELESKLNIFKEKLKQAKYYVYTINTNFNTFLEILGHTERKKYLIAFQNNDEIRPNGGFMGSLGIAEIFRGQTKEFSKNDIYFYEFKLKKETFDQEVAPEGINQMTPYFGLRDANYYINHQDSGDKIKFFMKKAGYPIDGIIYLNMTTLSKVLDIVGEFDSEVLQQKVNSSNFSTIMSILVESKLSQKGTTGTPKQVLFYFMVEFQAIIEERNISKTALVKILFEDIINREITLYNFNKDERGLMKSLSMYNPIDYFSSLDFNYPVFTSISGNKSDRYIEHSYEKIITKGTECSYYTSLIIKNNHTYSKQDQNYISSLIDEYNIDNSMKDELLFIQGNGGNKHYVRTIIPKEAEIINENVTIIDYKDRGQSVNFYMNTSVGEESEFKLDYYIPNKECKTYSYKFYKQPGIRDYDITIDNLGEEKIFLDNKKDVYIN